MENYLNLSARYYDASKPIGKSLDGDLEFYGKQIKDSKRILEAGVGTGRLLIPYLKEGLLIDGIDLSSEMLNICRSKCLEHQVETNLIEGDVSSYPIKGYDAIIVPTGSIALFEPIDKVLKNFYEGLNEGGFLLFDLNLPTDFQVLKSFTYDLEVDDEVIILNDYHKEIDWIHQKTKQILTYELYKEGTLIEKELQNFNLNWYGKEEMILMLKALGFKNFEVFYNYKTEELRDASLISIKAFK